MTGLYSFHQGQHNFVDCSRPPVFTNEQAGCRHQEANVSLPRETIGRESCSCRPTAILQILPDKPLAFIFQAADEHCALRQQDIELVHQVQNRQLVPTYVGALHNSRMSNDTDATPRLEIPVHGAYRGFPRFLLAHTVSRSRRVSSGE